MSTLRFCPHGGTTVSGNLLVPTDPADYRHRRVPIFLGCNHLVCSECGQEVRQAPNLRVQGLHSNLPDLKASDDWASLTCTFLEHDFRLYACACRGWLETHMHLMEPPDPDPEENPELPWRCKGHPLPSLPAMFDGSDLSDDASLLVLVDAAMNGTVPSKAPAPASFVPSIWLSRLYGYIQGTPAADAMLNIMQAAVETGHPTRVGTALRFYARFPRAPGFISVLKLAEEVGLGAQYPSAFGEKTIERQVGDAVFSRASSSEGDPLDAKALAMTLAGLSEPGVTVATEIVRELVRDHPEWAARNAVAIVTADPSRLGPLMYGLKDADEPAYEVVAGLSLAADPAVNSEALEVLLGGSYWRWRPSTKVILEALAKR